LAVREVHDGFRGIAAIGVHQQVAAEPLGQKYAYGALAGPWHADQNDVQCAINSHATKIA